MVSDDVKCLIAILRLKPRELNTRERLVQHTRISKIGRIVDHLMEVENENLDLAESMIVSNKIFEAPRSSP